MKRNILEYRVLKADDGMVFATVLKKRLNLSSRFVRKLKKENGIFINNKPLFLNIEVKEDDLITIKFPRERSDFEPQEIPLDVVYEDEHLLVINKQSNIVVHPTKGHANGTIANAVTYYMIKQKQQYKLRFVNRLDRDTTGLLIIGKNAFIQEALVQQMVENTIKKKYIAIVDGIIENDSGTINEPIDLVEEGNILRGVVAGGKESVTHYKVLKRINNRFTEVELLLETGRTHQIRVHMAHIGHAIIGDHLYGTDKDAVKRQALHAFNLTFMHPITNEKMELFADIPRDMQEIIDIN